MGFLNSYSSELCMKECSTHVNTNDCRGPCLSNCNRLPDTCFQYQHLTKLVTFYSMKNQHGRPNRPNCLRARKSLESIVSVVISLMTNTISRYHLHLGNMQDFEQYTGMTISICSVTYKLITAQSV